jgi:hypothetical protein
MRGSITPLPQYAFMASCSVKKSKGTNLLSPLPSLSSHLLHLQSSVQTYNARYKICGYNQTKENDYEVKNGANILVYDVMFSLHVSIVTWQ